MILAIGFVDSLRFVMSWFSRRRVEAFSCAHVAEIVTIGSVAAGNYQSAVAYNADVVTIGSTSADKAC